MLVNSVGRQKHPQQSTLGNDSCGDFLPVFSSNCTTHPVEAFWLKNPFVNTLPGFLAGSQCLVSKSDLKLAIAWSKMLFFLV